MLHNAKTGQQETILNGIENPLLIDGFLFEFSSDKKFLLVARHRLKVTVTFSKFEFE
jgi:hypothetical protein